MITRSVWLLALLLLLAGCASAPFSTQDVDSDLTPGRVQTQPTAHEGTTVLWGGRIVASKNLADRTRLEVVGYPLDEHSQRPRAEGSAAARFRVYAEGYLETAEYGKDRLLTVRGTVQGTEAGQVGEAQYTFPIVRADKLHLWSQQRRGSDSNVHFGVGFLFGN